MSRSYCLKCGRVFKFEKNLDNHEKSCNLTEEKIKQAKEAYLEGRLPLSKVSKFLKCAQVTAVFIMKDVKRSRSDSIKLYAKLHPVKLSEITKDKIRKSRIKYLNEHPEKIPYKLNHSTKESWIEKYFRETLQKNNITGWIQKYCCGIYEYDFAFPLLMIDVEIDGYTHELEHVKKIDQRRDDWSKSQGWRVLRFKAKHIRNDIESCIGFLQVALNENKIDQTLIDENFKDLQFNRHLERQKKVRQREIYSKKIKQERHDRLVLQKQKFENELKNIDITKFGWLSLLSKKMNLSHTHTKRKLKDFFPELQYFRKRT